MLRLPPVPFLCDQYVKSQHYIGGGMRDYAGPQAPGLIQQAVVDGSCHHSG